ncbi:MAG: hypothetical protein M3R21_06975 [Candidatus Dormibacteraeota bacterium]|nr:hypothetical protein [Candidatus Dormibacteraeota bacterium]
MELRQNMRYATTRPVAWVAAISLALALALIVSYAVPKSTPNHAANASKPSVTTVDSMLDRNAERIQPSQ